MKKITKLIAKIFASIIVLLIALMIIVPVLFKDKIKQQVVTLINDNVNAKVEFADFNLSAFRKFPNLYAGIEELTVVGVDTFSTDTLIKLQSFDMGINLFSLFGDAIKIKSISIKEPAVKVIVLADGTANYDIVKEDETSEETETTQEQTDTISTGSGFKLILQSFVINNGSIIYDDREMDMVAKIQNMDYTMNGDLTESITTLNNKVDCEFFTFIHENIAYLNNAKMSLTAKIDADLDNFKFTFNENVLNINELVLGFNGFAAMPEDDIDMDLTFDLQKSDFKNLLSLIPAIYMNDFSELEASGKVALSGYAKGTMTDTNMPLYGVVLTIENGNFSYPDLPKSVSNVNVDVKVDSKDATGEVMDIDLKKLHVKMADNPFDAAMLVNITSNDIVVKGSTGGTIDFTSISDIIPLDSTTIKGLLTADVELDGKLSSIENEKYEEFKAGGKIALTDFDYKSNDFPQGVAISKTTFVFSPQFVELHNFDATVGKSDFHLNGKLSDYLAYIFSDGKIKGILNFSSTLFDTNEFLPDNSEDEPEETKNTTEESDTTAVSAFEIPANIDFTLTSTLGRVIYDKLEITNIVGIIKMKEAKLSLENLKMNLLDGNMVMNGSYDSKDISKPFADFALDINGFDIKQAFNAFNAVQEIAPIAEKCEGKVSLDVSLSTRLTRELSPVYETMNGKGSLQTKQVGISDVEIFDKIADKLKNDKYRNTTLGDLNLSFILTNGNIEIKPFKVKIAGREAEIKGKQGIDQSIEYKIATSITNEKISRIFSSVTNTETSDQSNVEITIGGTLNNPKITAFKSALIDDVKNIVDEKIKEVKEEIKEELSEKAQKIIEDADKEAQKIIETAEKTTVKIKKSAKVAGEELIETAEKQGENLVKKAGSNPIKKRLAEESAKKLKSEAEKKAKQLDKEAEEKSNKIVKKAKTEAADIKKKAAEKAENM